MRVLALNQFYAPDISASAQLLTDLCEDLAAAGHTVQVVASPGVYEGGHKLPHREVLRGVEVLRPPASSLGKGSITARLADYLSFWASSVALAATLPRPDVLLALTTPPLIPVGAAAVGALRGVPLVTWVQDVYPEAAVALGALSASSPAVPLLRALTWSTHQRSHRIVALSEGMAERLHSQGADPAKIRVIANWSDGQNLAPIAPEQNEFRREQGLAGRFVAMYSGNLGAGHDALVLVEAARRLRELDPSFLLLFVGGGVRTAEAREAARELPNVRFLPYAPRERLGVSLSAADLHLITLRDGLEGLLVPSKLYGALAVGRPVVFVGPERCEVSRVLRRHQLGWCVTPGDVDSLVAAILSAKTSSPPSTTIRSCFEAHFDRPIGVARWREVLLEAAESPP